MIVRNEELPRFELASLSHRTIAGHAQGVKSMERWLQTMAPASATPVHRHACRPAPRALGRSVAGRWR